MSYYDKKKVTIFKYFFSLFFLILFTVQVVFAECNSKTGKDGNFGLDLTACSSNFDTTSNKTNLAVIVGQVVGLVLSFLGIIFMVLIIYGGFLWMNARGNQDTADKAKEIIINATIGVIIVFSAYAISNFVISNLGSVTSPKDLPNN